MSDYMPDDVLVKIFTHLPAKSLVRLTCVCKSWYSIITSADFINTHLGRTTLSNNNNNNHLILIRYCTRIPNSERISLHVDNDTFDLHEKIDFPFQSSEPYCHVYGSCNGLIFLSNGITEKTTLMLWNPSIRKSLTLSRPRFMYVKHDQAFGFGFDSRTNDYKVVRLVYRKPKGNVSPKVELYRLSTRSWETITATFDPSFVVFDNHLGGPFINGAVHWVVSKMYSSLILSFNMSDDEFSEILPPANLCLKLCFEIAVCGEWLSLFDIRDYKYCSVWAMKEYGVVDSWTNLYTLDLMEELRRPLGFRKNGELMLEKVDKELVSYDSETRHIKNFGMFCYCRELCFSVCAFGNYVEAYVESLVLLGDANRLGPGPLKEAKRKKKKSCFHES